MQFTGDNPLDSDLETYAQELDATLTVPFFVRWLRQNRPTLDRISDEDLERLATECLYRFAFAPLNGERLAS